MISKIFINLSVKDLDKSMAFFNAIGFSFNPQFTDKTEACMVMSEDIYAMLLTHDKVREFTNKPIADAHKTTELLPAVAVESKAKVNELRTKRLRPEGRRPILPKTMGSCSRAASRIRTAISGKSSGWTQVKCVKDSASVH